MGLTLLYAQRSGLMDVPNHRSSHSIPTPRGGGLGLVFAMLATLAYALYQIAGPLKIHMGIVILSTAVLAWVGWLDDRGSMPVRFRLPVHIVCGITILILVNTAAPLQGFANFFWLLWWVFWTVASINIVNFMDGIDGIIGLQGVIYGIFLYALPGADPLPSIFGLILAAACAGLLLWNWAPAKIFMGDVGSGPLGMSFVIGGALAVRTAPAPLVFLPLFPLFIDALITLIRRLRRGENLVEAHRSHLYQRIATTKGRHAIVSLCYGLAASLGAAIGVFAARFSTASMWMSIGGYVITILILWKLADARFTSQN